MPVNTQLYKKIANELKEKNITLVAVSKTKPVEDILELYQLGQRDFGENYVQELEDKYARLPKDIRWHFIGHLQSNKVKLIAPFISLIQSVDSEKLLKEINKQAQKNNRIIDCLLQVHIAREETKYGLDEKELKAFAAKYTESKDYKNVCIKGLMAIASFTDERNVLRIEFSFLRTLLEKYSGFTLQGSPLTILSMGMSTDYKMAIEEGSTMVRIGSLLFGKRS